MEVCEMAEVRRCSMPTAHGCPEPLGCRGGGHWRGWTKAGQKYYDLVRYYRIV